MMMMMMMPVTASVRVGHLPGPVVALSDLHSPVVPDNVTSALSLPTSRQRLKTSCFPSPYLTLFWTTHLLPLVDPEVRPSCLGSTMMAEPRITQTSPYDSPESLVF